MHWPLTNGTRQGGTMDYGAGTGNPEAFCHLTCNTRDKENAQNCDKKIRLLMLQKKN